MCPRSSKTHAAASAAPATVSTILARRGVLIALRSEGFSSRSERVCSSRRATTSSIRLRTASGGRDDRGMVQRGALLAGSTPWQSTRSLPSRAGGLHGRACRFRERPSRMLHSIGVLAVGCLFFSGFTSSSRSRRVVLRVASDGLLLGAIGAQRLESYVPSLLFSPVVNGNFPHRRLQRCVSRERLHDRRSADDRRRSSRQRHHDLLPVRGPLRNLRLPDLPPGDGDSAAQAGTPACLRTRL